MTTPDPEEPDEPRAREGKPPPAFAAHAAETDLLASIGSRVAARLLDGLIIGLPLTFLVFAASDISQDRETINTPVWVQLVAAAVSALYEILLIKAWGQTLGKRVLGIKVVRVTDGGLPDWTASVVRYLLPMVAVLIPVPILNVALSLVIYLAAVVHPLRRGWHDRAAGTIVIKAESPSRASPAPPPPSVNGDG